MVVLYILSCPVLQCRHLEILLIIAISTCGLMTILSFKPNSRLHLASVSQLASVGFLVEINGSDISRIDGLFLDCTNNPLCVSLVVRFDILRLFLIREYLGLWVAMSVSLSTN